MNKINAFKIDNIDCPVKYIETQQVSDGVICDVYKFIDDNSKDLAIVHVAKGCNSPLQRILKGNKTIEGYISGNGTLAITSNDKSESIIFPNQDQITEIILGVGDIMQWHAIENLVFYEICEPPYEFNRFEVIV